MMTASNRTTNSGNQSHEKALSNQTVSGESSALDCMDSICWDDVFEADDLMKCSAVVPYDGTFRCTATGYACHNCITSGSSDDDRETCSTEFLAGCPSSCSPLGEHFVNHTMSASRFKILAAKLALNSGKEHTSVSGKIRKARLMKRPCHPCCMRCEQPKLSEAERKLVFEHFWSLKDHEQQWLFISHFVKVSKTKRKLSLKGSKGEKHWSRTYFLVVHGRQRRVCKTMFKNTLSICDSWVDSALSHTSGGLLLPDRRGKKRKEKRRDGLEDKEDCG